MKKLAYGALALAFVASYAGLAAAQTIDDIHLYDPLDGTPTSIYIGTQVTVEGRIFVIKGTYNGGTHYIQDDTGDGINFYLSSAPPLDYGDRVSVTGYVDSYGNELGLTDDFGTYPAPVVSFLGNEAEPTPQVMTVAEVIYGVGGEDRYENVGKFADVTATVATLPSTDYNHSFNIHTGTDTLVVFIDGTTLINDTAVDIGDTYRIIAPIVKYNELIELKPRKQSDLIEGSGPVIDDVNCVDWTPLAVDAITVEANITDDIAVTGASLYYRDDDGSGTGVFTTVVMFNSTGDTWSGIIPAPHTERQVDYYIEATDGTDTSLYPGNAPTSWNEVAVGFTPIYDVQYVDPSNSVQDSPLFGKVANLTGIVMVGTNDAGAASKFIFQDAAGAFNGILVYESSAGNFVLAGDEVQVGGYINEYNGLSQINPHNASAVTIESYTNDLYPPVRAHTGVLSDDTLDDGNGILGEAYESVWVTTHLAAVTDTAGYDPYFNFDIVDVSRDTLVVDSMVDLTYVASPGDVVRVTGFMDYYTRFELVPLQDEAIVVTSATGVEDELPQIMPAGGFKHIAPNPFNPKTEISIVLTRDNLTQLNIYSIRGELVRTLASGRLETGEHVLSWDGNDFSGQKVSSGTYFARLRIGSEVLQVRKLMLLK